VKKGIIATILIATPLAAGALCLCYYALLRWPLAARRPQFVVDHSPWAYPLLMAGKNPGTKIKLKELPRRFPKGDKDFFKVASDAGEPDEVRSLAGMCMLYYKSPLVVDVLIIMIESTNRSSVHWVGEALSLVDLTEVDRERLVRAIQRQGLGVKAN